MLIEKVGIKSVRQTVYVWVAVWRVCLEPFVATTSLSKNHTKPAVYLDGADSQIKS